MSRADRQRTVLVFPNRISPRTSEFLHGLYGGLGHMGFRVRPLIPLLPTFGKPDLVVLNWVEDPLVRLADPRIRGLRRWRDQRLVSLIRQIADKGLPIVVISHNLRPNIARGSTRTVNSAHKFLAQISTRRICLNDSSRIELERIAPGSPIIVIPHLTTCFLNVDETRRVRSDSRRRTLIIGGLEPRKTMLESFALAPAREAGSSVEVLVNFRWRHLNQWFRLRKCHEFRGVSFKFGTFSRRALWKEVARSDCLLVTQKDPTNSGVPFLGAGLGVMSLLPRTRFFEEVQLQLGKEFVRLYDWPLDPKELAERESDGVRQLKSRFVETPESFCEKMLSGLDLGVAGKGSS